MVEGILNETYTQNRDDYVVSCLPGMYDAHTVSWSLKNQCIFIDWKKCQHRVPRHHQNTNGIVGCYWQTPKYEQKRRLRKNFYQHFITNDNNHSSLPRKTPSKWQTVKWRSLHFIFLSEELFGFIICGFQIRNTSKLGH